MGFQEVANGKHRGLLHSARGFEIVWDANEKKIFSKTGNAAWDEVTLSHSVKPSTQPAFCPVADEANETEMALIVGSTEDSEKGDSILIVSFELNNDNALVFTENLFSQLPERETSITLDAIEYLDRGSLYVGRVRSKHAYLYRVLPQEAQYSLEDKGSVYTSDGECLLRRCRVENGFFMVVNRSPVTLNNTNVYQSVVVLEKAKEHYPSNNEKIVTVTPVDSFALVHLIWSSTSSNLFAILSYSDKSQVVTVTELSREQANVIEACHRCGYLESLKELGARVTLSDSFFPDLPLPCNTDPSDLVKFNKLKASTLDGGYTPNDVVICDEGRTLLLREKNNWTLFRSNGKFVETVTVSPNVSNSRGMRTLLAVSPRGDYFIFGVQSNAGSMSLFVLRLDKLADDPEPRDKWRWTPLHLKDLSGRFLFAFSPAGKLYGAVFNQGDPMRVFRVLPDMNMNGSYPVEFLKTFTMKITKPSRWKFMTESQKGSKSDQDCGQEFSIRGEPNLFFFGEDLVCAGVRIEAPDENNSIVVLKAHSTGVDLPLVSDLFAQPVFHAFAYPYLQIREKLFIFEPSSGKYFAIKCGDGYSWSRARMGSALYRACCHRKFLSEADFNTIFPTQLGANFEKLEFKQQSNKELCDLMRERLFAFNCAAPLSEDVGRIVWVGPKLVEKDGVTMSSMFYEFRTGLPLAGTDSLRMQFGLTNMTALTRTCGLSTRSVSITYAGSLPKNVDVAVRPTGFGSCSDEAFCSLLSFIGGDSSTAFEARLSTLEKACEIIFGNTTVVYAEKGFIRLPYSERSSSSLDIPLKAVLGRHFSLPPPKPLPKCWWLSYVFWVGAGIAMGCFLNPYLNWKRVFYALWTLFGTIGTLANLVERFTSGDWRTWRTSLPSILVLAIFICSSVLVAFKDWDHILRAKLTERALTTQASFSLSFLIIGITLNRRSARLFKHGRSRHLEFMVLWAFMAVTAVAFFICSWFVTLENRRSITVVTASATIGGACAVYYRDILKKEQEEAAAKAECK